MKNNLKTFALLIVVIPLLLVRCGTTYHENTFGTWMAPTGINVGKIVIMKAGSPRYTLLLGEGPDTITATITDETTSVSPWVFLPLVQRGRATATASVELRIGGSRPEEITVSAQNRYARFGVIPDIHVYRDLRRQIDKAIKETIQTRIKASATRARGEALRSN